MGSFMIYQALCDFCNIDESTEIAKLIHPARSGIKHATLKATLNSIYSFAEDDKAIKDIANFEYYRRHYPARYEWRHYDTCQELPLA